MTKSPRWLAVVLIAVAVVAALVYWSMRSGWLLQPPPDTTAAQSAPPVAESAAAPAVPQIRYPIEPSVGAPAPADAQAAIEAALIELIGRDAVRSALQVDGFARRFVATVDNLGRTHAPPMSWPVVPAAGRFTVRGGDDGLTIGPENAARYAPFVSLVESVATDRAVALYVRFYPAFQRAYEELGFPGRHFNDRLIEVVDLLLATPKAASPLAVQLSEVRGPYPATRPWVRYRFADADFESLAAGQKILLRVGAEHRQRLLAKLGEARARLVAASGSPKSRR